MLPNYKKGRSGNLVKHTINMSIFFIILLSININTIYAQENNTVKSDELINFFTPQKEAVDDEKSNFSPGPIRGIGGIRQGHSNSPLQEGSPKSLAQSKTIQPEARKSFQNILFDINAHSIKESSFVQLDEIGKALKIVMTQYPESVFIIEGHTDSTGNADHNKKLSMQRAQTVKDFLIYKFGLDRNHIKSLGFGESKPIGSNDNKFGRSMNRRVEIIRK